MHQFNKNKTSQPRPTQANLSYLLGFSRLLAGPSTSRVARRRLFSSLTWMPASMSSSGTSARVAVFRSSPVCAGQQGTQALQASNKREPSTQAQLIACTHTLFNAEGSKNYLVLHNHINAKIFLIGTLCLVRAMCICTTIYVNSIVLPRNKMHRLKVSPFICFNWNEIKGLTVSLMCIL